MQHSKLQSASSRNAITRQDQLEDIADNTLSFFSETAIRAQALLVENHVMGASTLAAVNTLMPDRPFRL